MTDSKPVALRRLGRAQTKLDTLEAAAKAAAITRDALMLDAQHAGATYPEMEAATGLSTARVTQVLRRERTRNHD